MALRLFLGVFPPPEILDGLEGRLGDLPRRGEGARWTLPGQRHVTLFFLGETPEGRRTALGPMLEEVARGFLDFKATVKGLEGFPTLERPQTLVVPSVAEGEAWLRLSETLRPGLERQGFALEKKPIRPHMTLARVKDPSGVARWLPRLRETFGTYEASWRVDRFCLVASRLEPTGARYETLEVHQLKRRNEHGTGYDPARG